MAHLHEISDSDVSFVIDPITRAITTGSSKLYLAQHDHNSERYTFKVPRFIEGHDLSQCDTVMVDYVNVDKKKTMTRRGAYWSNDVAVVDDYILFSWLVSREATQLVGYLTFSVSFRCHDDDSNIIYEWGTDTFKRITIIEKTRNDQSILSQPPGLVDQLRTEILESVTGIIEKYFNDNPIDVGSKLSISTVELLADKWISESDSMHSQIVSIEGVNENSQVDLTPTAEQLAIFYEKDLTFVTENDDGVVTVYAIGQKPMNDYVIQVTVKEVNA